MARTYHQLRAELLKALAVFLDAEEAQAETMRWFEDGLGLSRSWMVLHGGEEAPPAIQAQVETWLERRRQGEPWAYLLGWSLWRERRFEVTPATLIPRPETELVLEAALDLGRRLKVDRVVDVGTGSGILGITLALETPWAVTATDLSPEALTVARRNAQSLGADLNFAEGHLLDPVPGPLGLVVSNPPYVDPADAPSLQRELAWEPPSALFAEEHGLALSLELLRQARHRAAPACVLEIGAAQGEPLTAHAQAMGWKRVQVHQDLAGHDRVLMVM